MPLGESLLGAIAAFARSRPDETGVLLDVSVENVRCVLVRISPHQSLDLSPRESEIARMVARGHPNKIIAATLDISLWTVVTHLRRIFSKLRVTSRAAMVARLSDIHHPAPDPATNAGTPPSAPAQRVPTAPWRRV